jgi:hypothetical protein
MGRERSGTAAAALVSQVRASAARATSAALDELATALAEPVVSMSLRAWPLDFPDDIAIQRRPPYEARAEHAPRETVGPWTKDHRIALAATVLAG